MVGGLGETSALGSADLRRFAALGAERIADLGARRAVVDLAGLGFSLAPESAAASVVAGFGEVLAERGVELVLRCAVPLSEQVRWQVVLERAVSKQSFRDLVVRVGAEPKPRKGPRPPAGLASKASLGRSK